MISLSDPWESALKKKKLFWKDKSNMCACGLSLISSDRYLFKLILFFFFCSVLIIVKFIYWVLFRSQMSFVNLVLIRVGTVFFFVYICLIRFSNFSWQSWANILHVFFLFTFLFFLSLSYKCKLNYRVHLQRNL